MTRSPTSRILSQGREMFVENISVRVPENMSSKKLIIWIIIAAVISSIAGGLIGYTIQSFSENSCNDTSDEKSQEATVSGDVIPTIEENDNWKNYSDADLFRRQHYDLGRVGCRPKEHVLNVVDMLSPEDALRDKQFFPKKVVLNRCSPSESYCAGGKRCSPDKVTTKEIIISYKDGNEQKFVKRNFEEHSRCKCLRP